MTSSSHQTKVTAAGRPAGQMDMLGIRLSIEARMGEGDADTAVVRLRIGSGQSVPSHTHETECIYVLDGQLQVFVADQAATWQTVDKGGSVIISAGLKHAIRNASDRPTDVLAIVSNRLANFFEKVSKPSGAIDPLPPTQADVELFVSTAAIYEYWLASPEESAAITG